MKLYYYKGACSLAVRIIIYELGLKCSFESLKELQTNEKITEDGRNFKEISPKNQIPVLELDDGRILTECSAIMTYLADSQNNKSLTGEGSFTKYRVLEWLSFTSTEIHKNFIPNIHPAVPSDAKPLFRAIFLSKIKYAEKELTGKDYVAGGFFTIADAYFFVTLTWLRFIKADINEFPNLAKYFNQLKARPSISKALKDEGL